MPRRHRTAPQRANHTPLLARRLPAPPFQIRSHRLHLAYHRGVAVLSRVKVGVDGNDDLVALFYQPARVSRSG